MASSFFLPRLILLPCSFVKHYYEILTKKPTELYKFYLADASFSHHDDDSVSSRGILYVYGMIKHYSYGLLASANIHIGMSFKFACRRRR
ncbi:hypothetical protein EON63_10015 [archaeon]|nr:MAG: hypothetical protein EON63_10015 [archaeon]